ncbi:MAG: bifunctional phosphopantothenoylcysteine decarboxylase/phosphopantothenate--cysteine ligase CoaBC [Pseudohongiellaceae bacterium]
MKSLINKRILLGVTGGIAAYKSAELTRLFKSAGADVRVAMSPAATEFITALTLQALSGNRVHQQLLDEEAEAGMGHIELARWADLILIAPATADFIARTSQGQANDLLTTVLLASKGIKALAPAMNQGMWSDPGTQRNLSILIERGFHIFGPGEGEQACGDIGPGRMLEPEALLASSASLFSEGYLAGRHLVITGGPTREALDPVRFLSNHSSGKMAYALANAAIDAGARVTLISGHVHLPTPDRVARVDVVTADDMLQASLAAATDCDVFIGAAAVADYKPAAAEAAKIKKKASTLSLDLVRNTDIITEVAALNPRPFVVGFAAETEDLVENGREKLLRKNLDLVFVNDAVGTFGSDDISAIAIERESEQILEAASKDKVARAMLHMISDRLVK